MTELASAVCQRFIGQINDQIAAGQHFDYLQVGALKEQIITSEAKKTLGLSESAHLTLYDLAGKSVEVLGTLRFVYLASLLEAFGKEYIAERDSVDPAEVRRYLLPEINEWKKGECGRYRSTSFFNLKFLRFVLQKKYQLEFSLVEERCFWEAGPLRNCLVHDGGVIATDELRSSIRYSVEVLNMPKTLPMKVWISGALIWRFIESSRGFIRACDYSSTILGAAGNRRR